MSAYADIALVLAAQPARECQPKTNKETDFNRQASNAPDR
jgi:hypothetical protein